MLAKLPGLKAALSPAFRQNFANFSVELESKDSDYFVKVYNDAGKVIEEINALDLIGADRKQNYHAKIARLFQAARRRALKVEKVFDEILEALA